MFGILDKLIMVGGTIYRKVEGIIDIPAAPDYYFNYNLLGKRDNLNFALLPVSTYTFSLTRRAFIDDKTALTFVLPRLPILPEPKVMSNFIREHSKRLLDEIYSREYKNLEIRGHTVSSIIALWLASQDSRMERRIKKLVLLSSPSDCSIDSWNCPSTQDIYCEARRRGYCLEDYRRELADFDFENYGSGLKDCEIEIHHGTRDKMIPFEMGMRLVDRLKSVGNNPDVVVYPGHDHTSTLVAYALRRSK